MVSLFFGLSQAPRKIKVIQIFPSSLFVSVPAIKNRESPPIGVETRQHKGKRLKSRGVLFVVKPRKLDHTTQATMGDDEKRRKEEVPGIGKADGGRLLSGPVEELFGIQLDSATFKDLDSYDDRNFYAKSSDGL